MKAASLTLLAILTVVQPDSSLANPGGATSSAPALITGLKSLQAMNPPHLNQLPAVERVMSGIKGSDQIDTAARQAGAFWQLRRVIYDIALSQGRDDREVTPDEKRLADAYLAAYYNVWLPLEKSLSQDRPRLFKLQGYTVNRNLLDEVLDRLVSPAFRAEYFKAIGQMDARIQARKEAEQQAFNDAQAAAKSNEAAAQTGYNDPGTIEARRCIESGRNPLECAGAAMGKGLNEMLGVANPAVKLPTLPPGLYMHGFYANQSGFNLGFGRQGAVLKCGELVPDAYAYVVEMKDTQVLITLQTKPKPVVLSFTRDGKLLGPATAEILGRVIAGYNRVWTEKRRLSDNSIVPGSGAWENVAIYAPKLERCSVGVLGSTGAPPAEMNAIHLLLSGAGALDNQAKQVSNAKELKAPAGLRMNGQYLGQGGFSIQFNRDESAVFTCGDVDVAHSYTVEKVETQVMVKIEDDARLIVLALRPDGVLEGSGPVELRGRKVVGMRDDPATNSSEPVFAPKSARCVLGVLQPKRVETPGAAEAGAAAARERYNAPLPAASNSAPPARPDGVPANTNPASPSGASILAVETRFGAQPGAANPLAGQSLFLMKESLETALVKAGFRPPTGMSAIKGWVGACNSGQPVCNQTIMAAMQSSAGVVKTDIHGKAQFAAVPAGTYYVFAITRFNNQPILWNLRVDLKPGTNPVSLSPNNAEPLDR